MNSTESIHNTTGVKFTELGAMKVRELLPEGTDLASAGLRIEVGPGGCSGFEYRLAFDHAHEGDVVFEDRGLRILIESQSLPYVDGSTIDWADNSQGLQIAKLRIVHATPRPPGCGRPRTPLPASALVGRR